MKKILVYLIIGFIVVSNIASATILAVSQNGNNQDSILIARTPEEAGYEETGEENNGGNKTQVQYNAGSESSKDFWGNATNWFNKGSLDNSNDYGDGIISTMEDMILVLGTTVIVIATIVLGIKFMFGSVDSKVDAKEGMLNLLVACVFFFGWNSIKNLLFPGNNFIFLSTNDTSYTDPIGRIFNIATYVLQFLAIIAIIYVGIRYIFAGVQGKTDLKEKSGMFLIGIILAFCSTGYLTYISKIINEALAK